MIKVPINRSTARRINRMKRPGETDNDVLKRTLDAAPVPIGQERRPLGFQLHAEKSIDAKLWMDPNAPVASTMQAGLRSTTGAAQFGRGSTSVLRVAGADASVASIVIEPHARADDIERVLGALSPAEAIELRAGINNGTLKVKPQTVDRLAQRDAAMRELAPMIENPVLQKLAESCFYKAVEAWKAGNIILRHPATPMPERLRDCVGTSQDIGVFVVQHDWSAAFDKAQDFADGEYRFPYDETVFEFRITGHRTCCSVAAGDAGVPASCILTIETSVGWLFAGFYDFVDGRWSNAIQKNSDYVGDTFDKVMALAGGQMRAIAIALEAEVAVTDVVRAPHRLNAKRERAGKLALFDYHVVSLARRARHAPAEIPTGADQAEHRGKRMHFVRGHWRHYATSRTWIKWHLRGDPDLGWIEKEYKL